MRKPAWASAEDAVSTSVRASNAWSRPRGASIHPKITQSAASALLTRKAKEGLAVKKFVSVLTVSLLGLGLATGAWAQARPSGDTKAGDTKAKGTSDATGTSDAQRQAWSPDPNAVETSKLIGTKVKTVDGKSIGEIDQLIVSQTDGKVTHVVLGKGGVLGMGE